MCLRKEGIVATDGHLTINMGWALNYQQKKITKQTNKIGTKDRRKMLSIR
jgi:hypothetical protein